MSRDTARAIRKEFRSKVDRLAQQFHASQSEQYPAEYRAREGERILKEISFAEASLATEMQKWNYAQQVEAARLRHLDPVGSPAEESRRLSERMDMLALAERYPAPAQARNILIPQAREFLANGNISKASVYFEAARKVGVYDGTVEKAIEDALDRTVPHRRQAIEIAVAAQDEFELSRRDVAAARLTHKIGTQQELVRASTAVQMADFKRQREAPVLAKELGIELPTSTD